ncbi:MAG: DUF86 domain-containing protein [Methanospirillaceae archaeon]|nr:DUF86 domain-containing protein [Methanospirillaceae archaeon]
MVARILEFVRDLSYNSFLDDKKTQFAVIRAFEVMGEAAKYKPKRLLAFRKHDDGSLRHPVKVITGSLILKVNTNYPFTGLEDLFPISDQTGGKR